MHRLVLREQRDSDARASRAAVMTCESEPIRKSMPGLYGGNGSARVVEVLLELMPCVAAPGS